MQPQDEDQSREFLHLLLRRFASGDKWAENELLTRVYPELRRLARRCMSQERANHTLQPTALVNEAYLRLAGQSNELQDRTHFLALAARVMRQVLVDHARARAAEKRGGAADQITLDEPLAVNSPRTLDVLMVHEAIEQLEQLDPRQARVVELHFFGGLSMDEIAAELGLGLRTVKRDWSMARAWLNLRLKDPA